MKTEITKLATFNEQNIFFQLSPAENVPLLSRENREFIQSWLVFC